MASISKEKDGWRIQFTAPDGSRPRLYLGKGVPKSDAKSVVVYVERLVSSKRTGTPPGGDVLAWLDKISDDLHKKLERLELAEPRQRARLKPFFDSYLKMRSDLAPATQASMRVCVNRLVEFFGPEMPLEAIGPGEAEEWLHYLRKGRRENTARKSVRVARQVFEFAKRKGYIRENPFGGLKGSTIRTDEKRVFVNREMFSRVLAEVRDPSRRLLLALARFAGIRMPSEAVGLKWSEVNRENGVFTVHSPKTARYGKTERACPIFPELAPFFQEAWDALPYGAPDLIFPNLDAAQNLRTWLEKVQARAAVYWPQPWQAMRRSRATELVTAYPNFLCCEWLGHSPDIADRFYRLQREEDIKRATMEPTGELVHTQREAGNTGRNPDAKPGAIRDAITLAGGCKGLKAPLLREEMQGFATPFEGMQPPYWAVLDSNQRLPPCEDGALTN